MRRLGHSGRVDSTQAEIVKALRACGYAVQSLAPLGGGAPDLLVARAGRMWLLEAKRPGGKTSPEQDAWRRKWGAPVGVVRSVAEALRYVEG